MATRQRVQPYPLRLQGSNAHVFTTTHGNTYAIRFVRYWQEDVLPIYLGIEFEVYEIYFEVVEIKNKIYDKRIQFTLMHSIIEFASVNNRVLFFDIDREDGRAGELLRVYNIWLKMYERQGGQAGLMVNRVVQIPDNPNAYLAVLVHHNNTLLHKDNADEIIDRAVAEIFPQATTSVM